MILNMVTITSQIRDNRPSNIYTNMYISHLSGNCDVQAGKHGFVGHYQYDDSFVRLKPVDPDRFANINVFIGC